MIDGVAENYDFSINGEYIREDIDTEIPIDDEIVEDAYDEDGNHIRVMNDENGNPVTIIGDPKPTEDLNPGIPPMFSTNDDKYREMFTTIAAVIDQHDSNINALNDEITYLKMKMNIIGAIAGVTLVSCIGIILYLVSY